MSNPTNPFSWQMPTATDLVTDLPADFEVFGQAVATSLADLLGGTTGQVLKKNTNADMDFIWAADSAGMTNPMTTTGDTIYSSSGSTPARLGIGSTGNVLTVAGGVPTWAAPAASGFTFTTWTPTWTRLTVGNGTVIARYGESGKFVFFDLSIEFGSTTSITGNNPEFTIPVAPLVTNRPVAAYYMTTFLDAGNNIYFGTAGDITSTILGLFGQLSGTRATLNSTSPFTWGSGDSIRVAGVYEAA